MWLQGQAAHPVHHLLKAFWWWGNTGVQRAQPHGGTCINSKGSGANVTLRGWAGKVLVALTSPQRCSWLPLLPVSPAPRRSLPWLLLMQSYRKPFHESVTFQIFSHLLISTTPGLCVDSDSAGCKRCWQGNIPRRNKAGPMDRFADRTWSAAWGAPCVPKTHLDHGVRHKTFPLILPKRLDLFTNSSGNAKVSRACWPLVFLPCCHQSQKPFGPRTTPWEGFGRNFLHKWQKWGKAPTV